MGISGSKPEKNESKIPEMDLGRNRPIPLDVINKIVKSVFKIIIPNKTKDFYGTGFFMKISDSEDYFITNNHVINQDILNRYIEIQLYNKKRKKLNLNDRIIKFLPNPRGITMIEIKKTDEIYNDIEFLEYDSNYTKGYKIYQNASIIFVGYQIGGSLGNASGIIQKVNDFEFDYDISTERGSSGSPIILYTQNENSILVIGIHKEGVPNEKLNSGTFIGEIFNNEYNKIKNSANNINNNYIIAEINIKQEDINKDIRIINSYEEHHKFFYGHNKEEYMNEEEIKKCEIGINNILIPFNYFYKFTIPGKYIIKYSFNNFLTKTNHMFSACSSLTSLNLSNFNTKNVTNMSYMFSSCSSLKNLDLSNIDTKNVTNMIYMFSSCSSLTNLNLSSFDTKNVTNMSYMFYDCSSLTNLNLSNFDTKNVTNMSYMFSSCSSLTNLNLSNFNTTNVTNMIYMFSKCSSLKEKCLSEFISLDKRIIGAAKGYYEYEPKIKNYNHKLKIVFETTNQDKVRILIDPNKTITELIKFYFQIIKRPELFGDEDIIFLCDGLLIFHDSKDLVKNHIIKYQKFNFVKDEIIILVDDIEDKIKFDFHIN